MLGSPFPAMGVTPALGIATIGGMSEMAHGAILVTIYAVVPGRRRPSRLFLRRDIAGAKGG